MSQFMTALSIGALLFCMGFLFWIQNALKPITEKLRNEYVVTVYFDPQLDRNGESDLVDRIKLSVGAQAEDIKVVETSQFISKMREINGNLARELEDLGPESNAIIPRYVTLKGTLKNLDTDKIKVMKGIEQIDSSKDRNKNVVAAYGVLNNLIRFLIIGVFFALLTGLIHLTRMNSQLHEDAVSLMKQWGAGLFETRLPTFISGLSVGIAGGALAFLGWIFVGPKLIGFVKALSVHFNGVPTESSSMGVILLMIGLILGVLSGLMAEFKIVKKQG
jgi:cell division protein FtsX